MGTLLFVHGTGVRSAGFNQSIATIEHHARMAAPGYAVRPCYWGGEFGAELRLKGVSIPDYEKTRDADPSDPASEEEARLTLWRLLWSDPLYEFRLLRGQWETSEKAAFGGSSELEQRLAASPAGAGRAAELAALLQRLGLVDAYATAATWLAEQPEFVESVFDPRAATVASRALVAKVAALSGATAPDSFAPLRTTPALRDELAGAILKAITEQTYGILGTLFGPVAALGTEHVRRHRGEVSDGASPAAGDILLYQARGTGIRDFIRARIREAEPPVVILAHSLGGIAAVDLLMEGEEPAGGSTSRVKLLVTVGSQAPYLYELGALQSAQLPKDPEDLPVEKRLPPHFPRWLNFFDRRDFLSYLANPVFGSRARDIEVNNGLAFPESHSAYWANGKVWEELKRALA